MRDGGMSLINSDIIFFSEWKSHALSLYDVFAERILSEIREINVKVQKPQIWFSNRRSFAFTSFLPVRRVKDCPSAHIVITFELAEKKSRRTLRRQQNLIQTVGHIMF